jgi:hypothetical protein
MVSQGGFSGTHRDGPRTINAYAEVTHGLAFNTPLPVVVIEQFYQTKLMGSNSPM